MFFYFFFDMGWELLPQFSRHSRCCLLSYMYVSPEKCFVQKIFYSTYIVSDGGLEEGA